MKKLFVSFALFSVTLGAFAQGSISFANRSAVGKGAFIYGVSSSAPTAVAQGNAADYAGREKLKGSAYVAALFAEVNGAWVQISGKSEFRDNSGKDVGLLTAVGKINPAGFVPDSKVNLVVRAWDAKAATWEEVSSDANAGLARGQSLVIKDYVVGAGDGFPSTTVQKTLLDAGLQSFGLYIVPEPSVVALGALGLGALLLRRRK